MSFWDNFFDFFRQSSHVGCCEFGNMLEMIEDKKREAKENEQKRVASEKSK